MPYLRATLLVLVILAIAGCAASTPSDEPSEPDSDGIVREHYDPPPSRRELKTGELILECELHIRAWQEAFAASHTEATREKISFTHRALGSLVHREKERLVTQAHSGPPRNRSIASAALGFGGDPTVLPILMNNVLSDDDGIAANALLGIGVLSSEDTPLGPLQEVILRNPNAPTAIFQNAAFAALQLSTTLNADPNGGLSAIFIPLLERPEHAVRAQACSGLGVIKAGHSVPKLSSIARSDSSPLVRTAACFALGEIGAKGGAESLLAALEDRDHLTAGTARGSLTKIFGTDMGADPDEWESVLAAE